MVRQFFLHQRVIYLHDHICAVYTVLYVSINCTRLCLLLSTCRTSIYVTMMQFHKLQFDVNCTNNITVIIILVVIHFNQMMTLITCIWKKETVHLLLKLWNKRDIMIHRGIIALLNIHVVT